MPESVLILPRSVQHKTAPRSHQESTTLRGILTFPYEMHLARFRFVAKAFVSPNRNVRLHPGDTNDIATGANWELNERKINYAKTPY